MKKIRENVYVLFSYELARRLENTGVTVNVLHPGSARTNFGREFSERTRKFLKLFKESGYEKTG